MSGYRYSYDIDWSNYFSGSGSKRKKSKRKNKSYSVTTHKKNNVNRKHITLAFYALFFISLTGFVFFLSVSLSFASAPVPSNFDDLENFDIKNADEIVENFLFEKEIKKEENVDKITFPDKINFKKYRVRKNDSLDIIAKKFGLKVDTLALINNIKNYRSLRAGTVLNIPNQNGRYVTVSKNDSIFLIANRFGASWKKITDVNDLESSVIIPGMKLFIPGAVMTKYERTEFYKKPNAKRNSERRSDGNIDASRFYWPVRGKITSNYGWRIDPFRQVYMFHKGIDIRGTKKTPVYSAKNGKVAYVGWSRIYGNIVMVKHDKDYVTVYAHLSIVSVKKGETVQVGDVLGKVGSSGRSTGTHLHFEIRKNGKTVDPLKILNK